MTTLKAGVETAIGALQDHFSPRPVHVFPSACGGAHVVIEDVPVGPPFAQASSWVGFFLSSACPEDDTYPFFFRADLSLADGRALTTPFHPGHSFPAGGAAGIPVRPAVMVSRRQRNTACWAQETPLLKLLAVLKWMSQR